MGNPNREVTFTTQQIEYLKERYPVVPVRPNQDREEALYLAGAASVVQHLEARQEAAMRRVRL